MNTETFLVQRQTWSDNTRYIIITQHSSVQLEIYPTPRGDERVKAYIWALWVCEGFRLMDVPDNYISLLLRSGISNSQLYKLAGNSIVVACLYHIFRKMFCEKTREANSPQCHSREQPKVQTLTLF